MLVEFKEIIEAVLHHEGGYVNDPKDLVEAKRNMVFLVKLILI